MQKIDKGVPIPAARKTGKMAEYPWDKMNIGDSFLSLSAIPHSGHNIAKGASVRYAPKRFRAAKDGKGKMRIWRIA